MNSLILTLTIILPILMTFRFRNELMNAPIIRRIEIVFMIIIAPVIFLSITTDNPNMTIAYVLLGAAIIFTILKFINRYR